MYCQVNRDQNGDDYDHDVGHGSDGVGNSSDGVGNGSDGVGNDDHGVGCTLPLAFTSEFLGLLAAGCSWLVA